MEKEFKNGTSYITKPFTIKNSKRKHITRDFQGEIISDEILKAKYIYE